MPSDNNSPSDKQKNWLRPSVVIIFLVIASVYLLVIILTNYRSWRPPSQFEKELLQQRYQLDKIRILLENYYDDHQAYPDSLKQIETYVLEQWKKKQFMVKYKGRVMTYGDAEFFHNFSTNYHFTIHDYAKQNAFLHYFQEKIDGSRKDKLEIFNQVKAHVEHNQKQHDLLDPNKPIGIKNIATQKTGYGKAYSDFRDALGEKIFSDNETTYQLYQESYRNVLLYTPLKNKQAFLIFLCMPFEVSPILMESSTLSSGQLVYKNKRIFKELKINFDVNTNTLEVTNLDELIKEL